MDPIFKNFYYLITHLQSRIKVLKVNGLIGVEDEDNDFELIESNKKSQKNKDNKNMGKLSRKNLTNSLLDM